MGETNTVKRRIESHRPFGPCIYRSYYRGNSPAAMAQAYFDWVSHSAMVPGKQMELAKNIQRNMTRYAPYAGRVLARQNPNPIKPLPQDYRFKAPGWQKFPFNLLHQAF